MKRGMDPHEFLGIFPNPDGRTYSRRPDIFGSCSPSPAGEPVPVSPSLTATVSSVDLLLNPSHGTSIRLFLPQRSDSGRPLPLIIHFHGGGFVHFSPATPRLHAACAALAASLPAAVASVDYRLAPEHRLPAAYEDAAEAIEWACSLSASAALGFAPKEVFLMGDSAGGNIALRAALDHINTGPGISLAGVILNQTYYGGRERTPSETKYPDDKVIPLRMNDLLWELSLPLGADRGHDYCDFAALEGRAEVGRLPPCLVRGYRRDPLLDRQRMLAEMLERAGVVVEAKLDYDGSHAWDLLHPAAFAQLIADVKSFFTSIAGASAAGGGAVAAAGRQRL